MTKRKLVTGLLLMILMVFLSHAVYGQTEPQVLREYSLGDGYVARDVSEGPRKYTFVKFPDRMIGNETPCSFVLFAEAMHVALIRVYGESAFFNREPKILPTKDELGISFYADTNDNHHIKIVIMVQTLESRYPIGVRLEKLPIQLRDF